ncbi:hypothetical protein HNR26_000447 [Rhizobium rosettiformans]|uniref:HEPN domain-containing protein n=2 Tax=Rhizobium rosettiformans TaxID=1368430 RepID=A0A7W8MBQ8_9HYPH|nr:hypothetical protein [Rhizobium rosettiformans]MBB5274409.1 hypothetical protein [Rhizobium rosettiformans]
MSERLTTAVKMGISARQILNKARTFPDANVKNPFGLDGSHIGVEPMLLALSMELALKAWYVFDYDKTRKRWYHDLDRIFDSLTEGSRQKLDTAFKATVAPLHPSFFCIDYGIRDVLFQHRDAFVRWRYLHERGEPMMFERSVFEATLEMVIVEFEKRYRTEQIGVPALSRRL